MVKRLSANVSLIASLGLWLMATSFFVARWSASGFSAGWVPENLALLMIYTLVP